MRIQPLALGHRAALTAFLADFDAAGEAIVPAYFAPRDASIEEVVALHAAEGSADEASATVPATTRFAVGDDGALLGVVNVRHRLNERLERFGGHVGYSVRPGARGRGVATALLQHALGILRDLDVREALLTCDVTNVASATVIERCGGVAFERAFLEELGFEVTRYHVPVPA